MQTTMILLLHLYMYKSLIELYGKYNNNFEGLIGLLEKLLNLLIFREEMTQASLCNTLFKKS